MNQPAPRPVTPAVPGRGSPAQADPPAHEDSGPLRTQDGRYLVVRGRLWRATDPRLPDERVHALTADLMAARRDTGVARRAGDDAAVEDARARVDEAKRALGERGPVWWADGAPDLTRHLARTTVYAQWFAQQP